MSDKVKEALLPIAEYLDIELVGDFGKPWTEVILEALAKHDDWLTKFHHGLGVAHASTTVETMAAKAFKNEEDHEAKLLRTVTNALRDLAKEELPDGS